MRVNLEKVWQLLLSANDSVEAFACKLSFNRMLMFRTVGWLSIFIVHGALSTKPRTGSQRKQRPRMSTRPPPSSRINPPPIYSG